MNPRLDPSRVPGAVLGVLECLAGAGHEAWLVGGGVRDLLRTDHPRPAKDWDVATSARPEAVTALFRKVVPTGIDHGTVTVLTADGPVEVTTFRGETGYTDARRPDQVAFLEDVDEDLARRDFTINAIAWNPLTGEIRDPFDGLVDLEAGIVRAVRDPVERFTEDGLRPMRAVRFAAVLEFVLDEATRAAIPATVGSFRRVAAERIQQELERLLLSRRPSIGIRLMAETGLAGVVLPELVIEDVLRPTRLAGLDAALARLVPRCVVLLDAAAAPDDLDPAAVLERLRFPKRVGEGVARLFPFRRAKAHRAASPADLRRILCRIGPDSAEDLAAVWRGLAGLEEGQDVREAETAGERLVAEAARRPPLKAADLALSGREVMAALSLPPGPAVGRALAHLLEAVLEDPEANRPEVLRQLLQTWRETP